MFDNRMHQKLTALEGMLLGEWLQLDSGVFKVDQSQAQFPLYSLQVLRQLGRGQHAEFHLQRSRVVHIRYIALLDLIGYIALLNLINDISHY